MAELSRPPLASLGDRAVAVVLSCLAAAVALVFCWMVSDILVHGVSQLDFAYLTDAPTDAGRAGGIGPILVSTSLILLVAMAFSVPLGLGAAVWLAERDTSESRFVRAVRASLDLLAGVPSIVFGLFGNAFFCHVLGLGFSILSGGLTLACMVLPIFIRQAEEGIRSVSPEYRRGGFALGLSRRATLFRLVLPSAAPGIAVGFTLGVGRALAETAALIFTSGYVDRTPGSLLDSGRSLSIHIYDLSMNVAGGNDRAYAAALVLVVCLLCINGSASWAAARFRRRWTTR